MKNIYTTNRDGKDVIIGCDVKHSSGVTIFYFKCKKQNNNKLRFNFILN